jgi:hypothetical protein
MLYDLSEPINVWVFFKKSAIKPHTFFWNKRQIKIDSINLVHSSKNGSSVFYHFAVSSGGNFYQLRFDTKDLKWFLEGVDED